MATFKELGLSQQALAAVKDLGYDAPTEVQAKAIPAALTGRDVIAAAKTGTGKTAAFSLPSMSRLGHARRGQGPLMLVVTPTRELAMQIEEVCKIIGRHTKHNVVCLVGGVSYNPQQKALARGCDVLVATPGRLLDLMGSGHAKLGQVETLVLDEADRMLDMGFLPDMKRIVKETPKNRQTLLFSATIDSGIEKNMGQLIKDPTFVEIAHKGETADTVEQYIVRTEQRIKNNLLSALLASKGSFRVIVFARTKHRVDNCCSRLRKTGIKVAPIHSGRSQNQRKRALDDFAAGKVNVLVATDVLARGIDVSEVDYVVNLDIPNEPEAYVHRIGRTGRAGEDGFSVTFVTPQDKAALKAIEKLIGRSIEEMEVEGFDAAEARADADRRTSNARSQGNFDSEVEKAAREYADKQEAKRKRNRNPQPQKTRGTSKKQSKKNQKGPQKTQQSQPKSGSDRKRSSNGSNAKGGKWHGDFRPGRANRQGR